MIKVKMVREEGDDISTVRDWNGFYLIYIIPDIKGKIWGNIKYD